MAYRGADERISRRMMYTKKGRNGREGYAGPGRYGHGETSVDSLLMGQPRCLEVMGLFLPHT